MSRSFLAALVVAMMVFANTTVVAQTTNLSPYSRYGLGDMNTSVTAAQFGMGGLGSGYADNTFVGLSNPATTAFLARTTFDFGLRYSGLTMSSNSESQKLSTTYVNHFIYAFSVKEKYCLTAGMVPYTRFGYTINDSYLVDSTEVNMKYTGTGGINRAFLGNAYKVYNHKDSTVLSIGLNMNFLFGTLNQQSRAYFPTGANYFNTRNQIYSNVHDISFDLGTYFSFYPNKAKNLKVNLGAVYSFATNLRTSQEVLNETFITNTFGNEFPVDTVSFYSDNKGSISLPQSFSIGASVLYDNRWVFGIDYRTQSWSNFSQNLNNTIIKDDLKNSSQLSVGIQFTPKQLQVVKSSVFNYINYRVGFRMDNTYIQVRNSQIKGTALTAGLGIPLKRSNSLTRINLGYEMSTRGTTDNNLLKEKYSTFVIGLSLSPSNIDRWFYKRKYD